MFHVCCRRRWCVTRRTRTRQESSMNILPRRRSCFRRCFQWCKISVLSVHYCYVLEQLKQAVVVEPPSLCSLWLFRKYIFLTVWTARLDLWSLLPYLILWHFSVKSADYVVSYVTYMLQECPQFAFVESDLNWNNSGKIDQLTINQII